MDPPRGEGLQGVFSLRHIPTRGGETSDIVWGKGTGCRIDSCYGFFDHGHGAEAELRKTPNSARPTSTLGLQLGFGRVPRAFVCRCDGL